MSQNSDTDAILTNLTLGYFLLVGYTMPNRNMRHLCGHSDYREVGRRNIEARERYKDWVAHNLNCRDCVLAAKRAEALERAKTLPALTGSPKQVDWATQIRHKVLVDAEERIVKVIAADQNGTKWLDALRKRYPGLTIKCQSYPPSEFLTRLLAHTEAKWWIDNRDKLDCQSVVQVLRAMSVV